MQQVDYSRLGFPRYFIRIGIALIIFPVVFMGITKWMYGNATNEFGERNVEIMKAIFNVFIITGLTFIAFARKKKQDELVIKARIAGLFGSFISGIFIVIITPLADLFFGTDIGSYDSNQLIILMLVLNIIYSHSAVKKIDKQQ